MAILRNTAEGRPNGTQISSVNTGGGSGNVFNGGSTSGSPTANYSNAQAMHGVQSYALGGANFTTFTLRWTTGVSMAASTQVYVFFTGYPAGVSDIIKFNNALHSLRIASTGEFSIVPNVGGALYASGAAAISLNTWYRFDICLEVGATTSDGRVQATMSLGDSTTPLFSYDSGYTANVGTVSINSCEYGKNTSTGNFPTFYMDDIRLDTAATGLLPPNVTSIAWLGL